MEESNKNQERTHEAPQTANDWAARGNDPDHPPVRPGLRLIQVGVILTGIGLAALIFSVLVSGSWIPVWVLASGLLVLVAGWVKLETVGRKKQHGEA